ncbi:MAG TPA: hypothetical protein VFZ27_04495 [Terriglobia bacterium]|nr:hypothetical protein [Terriglobia bacterium]
MQWVYELLAFLVALYFPVALLAWLAIDKFFASEEGSRQVLQPQPAQGQPNRAFANPSRPRK